ncbi:MAG: hypothetical protein E7178_01905 [Erysipelotrichaceae bacterium]|nr:hypothetical protein [Erysipelotrichaceae bacterium]
MSSGGNLMKTKLLTLFSIPLLMLSSCGSKNYIEVKERDIVYSEDYFRNYYEIFPIAYADSNGDGNGDLKGIVDKFDYIKSLNVTGLWLTPVHPSPTYHKYDVKDYKAIDSTFGTLDDYDALVSKCHDNHMNIILDLVLNHTSSEHPWFISCMEAHINNQPSNKYYNYYNVSKGSEPGYAQYKNSGYYYEARFWDGMPDLNLQGVIDGSNTSLINDLKDIMKFWLVTHKVDGFRLDACTSFFTGNDDKNYEFLTWVKSEAEKIKKNTYIIGEVLEGSPTYAKYYKNTNVDSYFAFDDMRDSGITPTINTEAAYKVGNLIGKHFTHAGENRVPAPLLANHDQAAGGRSYTPNIEMNKLKHGVLSILPGASFEYYGEEVGMKALSTSRDEDLRQPFPWGDKYTCKPVSGSTPESEDDKKYPLGDMPSQDKDENSMLNYFRKIYRYRLENPELMRGGVELYYESEDEYVGILKREYKGSSVYIALNLSNEKSGSIDVSDLNVSVVGDLSVGEKPYYDGNKIVLPPLSMILLH